METRNIAVFGLGSMGYGIASSILAAGHTTFGFDLNVDAAQRFRDQGGAEGEIEQVAASQSENERAKEEWASRLQALEAELQIVEQQIRIVDRYIERLHHDNPAPATSQRTTRDPRQRRQSRAGR